MSFKDAFNELIFTYGLDILKDNFRTRAILSDLVGSSYYDIKLIDIFCKVLKNYDLFNIFSEKGLKEGRLYLNNVYKQYKELCNGKEFADAINPISQMICPKEYKEAEEKKKSIVVNNTEIHKQLKEQVNNGELNLTEKAKVKPASINTSVAISATDISFVSTNLHTSSYFSAACRLSEAPLFTIIAL